MSSATLSHLYSIACWENRLYLVAIFYPQKHSVSYSYYLTVFVLPTRTISHLLCHETATLFSAVWLIECGRNLLALSMVTVIRNWTQALWPITVLSWLWLGAFLVSCSVAGIWSGCSARCKNTVELWVRKVETSYLQNKYVGKMLWKLDRLQVIFVLCWRHSHVKSKGQNVSSHILILTSKCVNNATFYLSSPIFFNQSEILEHVTYVCAQVCLARPIVETVIHSYDLLLSSGFLWWRLHLLLKKG